MSWAKTSRAAHLPRAPHPKGGTAKPSTGPKSPKNRRRFKKQFPVSRMQRRRFGDYLASFTGQEQECAFGKSALLAYRRGDITVNQLVGQGEGLVTLEQLRNARLAGARQQTDGA